MTFVRMVAGNNENSVQGATRRTGVAGNCDVRLDSSDYTIRAVIYPVPGDFKNLYARINANTSQADSTITLDVASSDTALQVTIGSAAIGVFEDLVDTVTINADERCVYNVVTGQSGIMTFGIIAISFAGVSFPDLPTNTVKVLEGFDLFHSAQQTWQHVFGSSANSTNSAAVGQVRANFDGIWDHFDLSISSNPKNVNANYKNQVNSSDGSLLIVVGAGATGLFSDHVNQDFIKETDWLNMTMTTDSSDGTIVCNYYSNDFHPHLNKTTVPFGFAKDSTDLTFDFGETNVAPLGGLRDLGISNAKVRIDMNGLAENIGTFITANSLDGETIIALEKDDNKTQLALHVAAGVTGQLNLLGKLVDIDEDDDLQFQIDTTASTVGSLTIRNVRFDIDITRDKVSMGKTSGSAEARKRKKKQVMGLIS